MLLLDDKRPVVLATPPLVPRAVPLVTKRGIIGRSAAMRRPPRKEPPPCNDANS
jgi:hypothetical protein